MTNDAAQLEQWLSERLDGQLNAEQATAVDRLLVEDPQAAATARAYERLAALLAGWRSLPPNVDWDRFRESVVERMKIAGAQEATAAAGRRPAAGQRVSDASRPVPTGQDRLAEVDHVLQQWAGPMPDVDWAALKTRISAAVRREAACVPAPSGVDSAGLVRTGRPWRSAMSWVLRVGAPLAAAAAVVLAVWWQTPRPTPRPRSGASASRGPLVLVAVESPEPMGQVSVRFDGAPWGVDDRAVPPAAEQTIGIQFVETAPVAVPQTLARSFAIAIGPSAREYVRRDAPLDEAFPY